MVEEPVLEIHEIQGNIVPGFNKDYQALLFLEIVDVPAAKAWLGRIADSIATLDEVLAFNRLWKAMGARRGREPIGLAATWLGIAVSYPGMQRLTPDAGEFPGPFQAGLAERAAILNDPADPTDEGNPARWVVGGPHNMPHLLLTVASDREELVEEQVHRLFGPAGHAAAAVGLRVTRVERGAVLPEGLRGHEHFGFKDGVSQPGVRGRLSDAPDDFLTPREIDPVAAVARLFGRPGQLLVWPGEFILGYPRQDDQNPADPLPPLPVSPAWTRNGSFLVFRRLRQDVPRFRAFVETAAAQLRTRPGFDGMTPARLAALMVGRWPSGAPLMRAPDADDLELGADSFAHNHFRFIGAAPATKIAGALGRIVDGAPADADGMRCPHAAHIRKVNPRDVSTESGSVLTRRMLRRGIPYGPPFLGPTEPAGTDRGLLFVAYQAAIEPQFELVQQEWANERDKPETGGEDPIIGQSTRPDRVRRLTLVAATGESESIDLPNQWVIPTGGGYFFAPSISAIKTELARPL